ncbi:MAG: aldo/keto reductase [Bacillota bacterium]|nr:aldo/keto reductase [Bacillota bacterium]
METRRLGSTGLGVSVIGNGTEYLRQPPQATVTSVIREAVEQGVNYIDVLFGDPDYRDKIGHAIKGLRDRIVVNGHIGIDIVDGQPSQTRDAGVSEEFFHDLLRRLGTDHVDVGMIQMVDSDDAFDKVMAPGGILESAYRLREQGKLRHIGISSHVAKVAVRAASSALFDVLMYPINFSNRAEEVAAACHAHGVGLVGMKPFMGGEFFQEPYRKFITPVNALSFALSRPAVAVVAPGMKNLAELFQVLAYSSATPEEKDYQDILSGIDANLEGVCTYCDHCLPCSAGISISQVMWCLRAADRGYADAPYIYGDLKPQASACTECGSCAARCPFKVDILAWMKDAVGRFESSR